MGHKVHIFYVGSYSHIVVADGIISEWEIPIDDVYFVTYRGVRLPPCYEKNLLFDESYITNRLFFFFKHFFEINKIVKDKDICGYFPFQGQFPVFKFFKEYVFYEEGLGAYGKTLNYSRCNKIRFLKTIFKHSLIAPFLSKNLRGIYNGRYNGSPFSFECTLVGLTSDSYKNAIINQCNRVTIHFSQKPLFHSSIKNSVIIVMDSTHAIDRMDSVDNYLNIFSDVLRNYDFNSRNIYLKLHPDNYKDRESATALIKKYLDFIDYSVIDESLEDIALSNQNNLFFGNHSTILFYAPIFGGTNKSVSFARINAERDATYRNFFRIYGGMEEALTLFKKQMDCL